MSETIREMLAAWTKIETEARKQFPTATAEELHQIVAAAMSKAVGIEVAR